MIKGCIESLANFFNLFFFFHIFSDSELQKYFPILKNLIYQRSLISQNMHFFRIHSYCSDRKISHNFVCTVYNLMQNFILPPITTLLQLSLLIPPANALYFYLRKSAKTLTSSWLLIITSMIFVNAYTIDIATRDLLDTLQQTSWLLYAFLELQSFQGSFHFAALGIASIINPTQLIAIFLGIQTGSIKNKLASLLLGFVFGGVIMLVWGVESKYYIDLYFPATMQPQFNLQWMLYACTFTRYIKLYQALFMILPFLAAFLIRSLKFSSKLELVLLTFFRLYSSYKCSQFALIVNIILCAFLLKQYLDGFIRICDEQSEESKKITVKTLTMIAITANITFFPLNKMLLKDYLNGFRVNFGYVFLFQSIYWGVNAIFLTQISILENQLKQKIKNSSAKSKFD